jgi:hypothetical protein
LPCYRRGLFLEALDAIICLVKKAIAIWMNERPDGRLRAEAVEESRYVAAHANVGVKPDTVSVIRKIEMRVELDMPGGTPWIRMIVT